MKKIGLVALFALLLAGCDDGGEKKAQENLRKAEAALEKEKVAFKEEPVSTWTRLKPLLYMAAMFVGAALIIRVASTDHKPAAADDVAVTEVDTEVVVSDEMIDVAVDRAMLDDYSLYVYLSDASVE